MSVPSFLFGLSAVQSQGGFRSDTLGTSTGGWSWGGSHSSTQEPVALTPFPSPSRVPRHRTVGEGYSTPDPPSITITPGHGRRRLLRTNSDVEMSRPSLTLVHSRCGGRLNFPDLGVRGSASTTTGRCRPGG